MNKNTILAALVAQVEVLRIEIRNDVDNATRAALTAGERVTSLASLARVAVADGRALNRVQYAPQSSTWHNYRNPRHLKAVAAQNVRTATGQPVCNVCLAGAVIAGSLDVAFDSDFGHRDLPLIPSG